MRERPKVAIDELVTRCWGRSPALVRRPFPGLVPTSEQVFTALVGACDSFRRQSGVPRIRVNIDGGFLLAGMDEHLPRADDGSFAGYAARLRRWLGERDSFHARRATPTRRSDFLLTLNDYHVYDLSFWRALRASLPDLYAQVGFPTGGLAVNLWVGMYRHTPIGIHTDHADTLWFMLLGRKHMRVWPSEAFAGQRVYRTPGGDHLGLVPDSSHPPGESLAPDGEDMAYWPPSYWHIGESDGELAVSMSLAFTHYQPPARGPLRLVVSELESLAAAALDEPGELHALRPADDLPAELGRARAAVSELAASPAFDEAVTSAWLRRRTGLALGAAPPPIAKVALGEDDRLRCEPGPPPMWAPGAEGRTIVAGAGASFVVPADPRIATLVAQLGSGTLHRVSALEAPFEGSTQGGCPRATIRLLLEQLVRVHALTVG